MNLPADTAWLADPDAQAVCCAIEAGGAHIYFVGGCVRDAVLGIAGSDTDLSTDAIPSEVTRLAKAAGFKVVPTGLDHGTVTIVAGGKGFEVTTFRRDVATDGRHADVLFSTDISEDARRRDFTMNALYATSSGKIIDPLNGLDDCINRKLRFIEDAATRIHEDYLRILRFFRFHAWYVPAGDGFDADALDAIAQNTRGLETLSAERIGSEMKRLLAAPDPAPAVAAMRQTGCLLRVLPGSDDRFLGPVVHVAHELQYPDDPILRLAALGGTDTSDRLRLSRSETQRLDLLKALGYGAMPAGEMAYRHGSENAQAALILRAALSEQPIPQVDLDAVARGDAAVFPIKAHDLMPTFSGKALGDELTRLEHRWIASDFSMSAAALLSDN